jgi:hypothetical protein
MAWTTDFTPIATAGGDPSFHYTIVPVETPNREMDMSFIGRVRQLPNGSSLPDAKRQCLGRADDTTS